MGNQADPGTPRGGKKSCQERILGRQKEELEDEWDYGEPSDQVLGHVYYPIGIHLEIKFKGKIIMSFKIVNREHLIPSMEGLLSVGPCAAALITHLESQPDVYTWGQEKIPLFI